MPRGAGFARTVRPLRTLMVPPAPLTALGLLSHQTEASLSYERHRTSVSSHVLPCLPWWRSAGMRGPGCWIACQPHGDVATLYGTYTVFRLFISYCYDRDSSLLAYRVWNWICSMYTVCFPRCLLRRTCGGCKGRHIRASFFHFLCIN